jgi:hypothetical protein
MEVSAIPSRTPTVNVQIAISKRGKPIYAVTLSATGYEATVLIPPRDVGKLQHVRSTPWLTGSMRIGGVAGQPAFWSYEKRTVSILVGEDDQMWEFGIFFSLKTLEKIILEIADCPLED